MSMAIPTCKCLDHIKVALEKTYGPVELDLSLTINMETGKGGAALDPLYFKYYPQKDGKRAKKQSRSYVAFSHCPFCGNKNGTIPDSDNLKGLNPPTG